jgi:flagellar hook protein FlgE
MSLYGIMRTGVSGMNAQSNKLGTVSDNIANQNTTGYKRASTEFASLLLGDNKNAYDSGSVTSKIRYSISQQGPIQYTNSAYDFAVSGNGFFPVRGGDGSNALTRAGSFTPIAITGADGNTVTRLMNTAGFELLGQKLPATGLPGSLAEMQPVEFTSSGLRAEVSTAGAFKGNLPALAAVPVPPALPIVNAQTSMVVYDQLGTPVTLDIEFAKSADNTWEVTVKDRGDASLGRAGSTLGTTTLTFNGTTGGLTAPVAPVALTVPHASQTGLTFPFSLDLNGMTQVGEKFTPYETTANGSPPSALDSVQLSDDGIFYEVYKNGSRRATYQIPLATVASPDSLSSESGNVFTETQESGRIQFGAANSLGFGKIQTGALEGSNVDIGTELALMIEAQSAYTANSKVFQTGSELIDVLMNLKR